MASCCAGALCRPGPRTPTPGAKMINARAETVAEKPAYRGAFERFRCLILADGFYEWQRARPSGPKQPFHITRAGGEPFAFAGLWSVWHRGEPDESARARSSPPPPTRPSRRSTTGCR